MNYVKLDENNIVIETVMYTDDEYALVLPERKDEIISCPAEITVGYKLTPEGWQSPNVDLDAAFAANPAAYKEAKCTIITNSCDSVLTNGFSYNGIAYKGDVRSQLWALGYMFSMSAGIMQPPVNWIAKDNTVTVFSTVQAFSAFIAFFLNWGQTATFANFQAKGQIRAASTRAQVDALFTGYMASVGL